MSSERNHRLAQNDAGHEAVFDMTDQRSGLGFIKNAVAQRKFLRCLRNV
jgi:hypothetical protein